MNCETEIVHHVCAAATVVVVATAAIVYLVKKNLPILHIRRFSVAVFSTHVSFDCMSRVHRVFAAAQYESYRKMVLFSWIRCTFDILSKRQKQQQHAPVILMGWQLAHKHF